MIKRKLQAFFREEPEEKDLAESLESAYENPKDVLEHLNVLRRHLIRIFLGVTLATALAFAFITQILDWLTRPVGGIVALPAIEVTEPVGVVMRVALLAGFTLSLPYIALEILGFMAPGLSRRGRMIGLLTIPLVALFFLGGMLFAYYVMIPAALPFLMNFMGFTTTPRPSSYVNFITSLMFWIGVCFEFPLVSYVLAAIKLLKPELLLKNWRFAVIGMAVMAAIITPTVDPINMLIVLAPLSALYLLGILMAVLAQGRKRRPAGANG